MAEDSPSGGARVEAQGLCREFGSHVALADVDLTVEPGETFGLLGANGAGKTTFIRLVTGYLVPTRGQIWVNRQSPSQNGRAVREQLGFAAERPKLYPDLRVRQYLQLAGGLRGLSGGDLEAAISRNLERFRIADHVSRLIGNLSKGYQQRVSLAQAFLAEPSLLIVDEPTSGLDPLQRAEVREILAGLRGHRTTLLCTHDLVEARQLCSRVAVLREGRVVASGGPDEVLGGADPLSLFRPASA